MANMIEQSLLCKVLDAPDLEILHSNGVIEEMFLIVSWETGKTAPKMEKAQELSDLYGIPLAYMDFSKAGNSTPLRERESEPQIPAF